MTQVSGYWYDAKNAQIPPILPTALVTGELSQFPANSISSTSLGISSNLAGEIVGLSPILGLLLKTLA